LRVKRALTAFAFKTRSVLSSDKPRVRVKFLQKFDSQSGLDLLLCLGEFNELMYLRGQAFVNPDKPKRPPPLSLRRRPHGYVVWGGPEKDCLESNKKKIRARRFC